MVDRLNDPAWQQTEPPDWSGYGDELDDEEPMDEESQQQDYLRAIDELNGLYPHHGIDHDRRYDDQYSQQQGDIGDQEFPF